MAHTTVQPVGGGGGYIPVNVSGALGQTMTVTAQEISAEVSSRGYNISQPAISPPVTAPITTHTMPAMTRSQAITQGVTRSLSVYGYSARCTRLGGCPLSSARFKAVVDRARGYANNLLAQTITVTRTASVSPLPYSPASGFSVIGGGNVSPRLSGVGRSLYGLGQIPDFAPVAYPPIPGAPPAPDPAEPGMTRWDWVAIISSATQGVASTLEAYANARAQRERAGQTATLTADQVKLIVNEALLQNPALNRAQLTSAAAGAGGLDEPKGLPSWVIPAGIGAVFVAFMSSRGRRF